MATPSKTKEEIQSLPLYLVEIPMDESDVQIQATAFVDFPAIEKNFMAFGKSEKKAYDFTVTDKEKRIVTGAMMIPNLPIFRTDEHGAYNVVFSAQSIFNGCLKYHMAQSGNNVNIMHDGKLLEGIYMFESFLIDKSRGIVAPAGYGDLPQGTWMASYYVANDDVWSMVKDGTLRGFSVEGIFKNRYIIDKQEDQIKQVHDRILGLTKMMQGFLRG